MSAMPSYAFSEGLAWFRFPLFVMATAFWLGTPGPLSWLERENLEFTQYLARRLCD